LSFLGECRGTAGFCFVGKNGRSTALSFCGVGCRTVLGPRGCASATVEDLLGCTVGPAEGVATPQAVHVTINMPAKVQLAHRGKARTWKPPHPSTRKPPFNARTTTNATSRGCLARTRGKSVHPSGLRSCRNSSYTDQSQGLEHRWRKPL